MNVLVTHLGARRYYALPRLFHEAGVLSSFHTDIFIKSATLRNILLWVVRISDHKGFAALLGRYHPALQNANVQDYKGFGIRYWREQQRTPPEDLRHLFYQVHQEFTQRIIACGINGADVIYAFPGEALELFQYSGPRALKILDQNAAAHWYVERQLKEERIRWPGWENPSDYVGLENDTLTEREARERLLADLIIAPSEFVSETLAAEGLPKTKLDIIPYPADVDTFPAVGRHRTTGPLRVLFLGTVNLWKGIPYLLEAALLLGPQAVTIRAVGNIGVSRDKLARYASVATFTERVPRNAVQHQMVWADVLCQPSLAEGQSLATNEALASGLPVICTPNAGSRVRDGVDGTIVPTKDIDALTVALERYVRDRDYLRFQSEQAIAGRSRLSYPAYRDALLSTLNRRFRAWKEGTT